MCSKKAILALCLGIAALVVVLVLARPDSAPPGQPEPASVEGRERKDLELRDGILYPLDDPARPFHGMLVEFFPDGARRIEIEIADGRPHGVSRGWFENGQLEVEETMVDGLSHGTRKRWHPNGSPRSESTIVQGVIEGTFLKWHENGVQAVEMPMKNGKPHGECRAWHPSGHLKSKAHMREGTVVKREIYVDHETAATSGPETLTAHK